MQRYQPADQEIGGRMVYRIVDTRTGVIYPKFWYTERRRNVVMRQLNRRSHNPVRVAKDIRVPRYLQRKNR